jgi:ubiquinone/menaquinone biosynthesis C-methylase UbiE
MFNSYGELCTEVYKLSKPIGFSYGDIEYYTDRLKKMKRSEVLEVACGSGRVLIPLIQEGLSIDGIDNSKLMLDSCREKCSELGFSAVLFEGDMCKFKLSKRYEAIIIPGGSIQLIESRNDLISALKCYHDHLKVNGILMIDTFLQTEFTSSSSKTRLWENGNNEVITLEEKRVDVDLINQRVISLLKYEKWKDGELVKTELQRLPLSWYGVQEFKLILENAGFADITISGNYKYGAAPEDASRMITYEARKI